jgi:hypothetical protein
MADVSAKRRKVLRVYLNKWEREALERLAKDAGRGHSDYMRELLLRELSARNVLMEVPVWALV